MRTRTIGKTKLAAIVFFFCTTTTVLTSVHAQQHSVPAIPGDFADPTIITDGKSYFATGTSSEWAPHYPVYQSSDLYRWEQTGYIFDKAPEWALSSFWAPEFFKIGNRYLVYYTARRKSDSISCIGVASSAYPDRGYTDHGVLVDFGKEAIDAFVFDDDGQLYISFKAYGLDNRPIELLACKLSADGLHLEGSPFTMLRDENKDGLEGQSMLKRNGYYYLFYSAGNCCGAACSYNVQVARSTKMEGPYERYAGNSLLGGYDDWTCTGHGSFVETPAGDTYYIHHAYNNTNGIYTGRQGMIVKLDWNQQTGWPSFSTIPSTSFPPRASFDDDFDGKRPAVYWQWDWRHATPRVSQSKGRLFLSGTVTPDNATGTVITVRPSEPAFSVATAVTPQPEALCGLAYYGDAGAAIGVGVKGGKIQYWMTKDNQFSVLGETVYQGKGPVDLKMEISADHNVLFYYGNGKGTWKRVNTEPVPIEFLPQWDRSPRPGLHVKGEGGAGSFEYFRLSYK